MYFKKFPKFVYDFDFQDGSGQREYRKITDITRNTRFRRDVLASITIYDYYDIKEGETPEIIAEKIYGSAEYHWIIMLMNERFDYRSDFPMSYIALNDYITDKYGEDADAVHHYENADGIHVDSDYPGAVSVSNRQYEEGINESKRRIKLPSRELISKILSEFKELM
jgi:hypothetical protein